MNVSVSTNCIYWVGFDVDKLANDEKPNFKFGFRLLIEDLDNNTIQSNYLNYWLSLGYARDGIMYRIKSNNLNKPLFSRTLKKLIRIISYTKKPV